MASLYDELKRRNVFRVGVAYVVAAWVVAQVADLVLENIGAPSWVIQTLFLLMAIGFVIALIIAWAYEVTPDGIKRERDVVREHSVTHETSKRLDVITIGLLVLAIGLLAADRLLLNQVPPGANSTDKIAASMSPHAQDLPAPAPGRDGGRQPAEEKSIAVLPFVNMSSDPEQDYFADGISEEILNALVKATGLRVAGRTSSFSFKGKDANIQEIGETLNVAHVLEGSVRKQGERVRITAQLIKSDDGFHLWSETYDRSLDNIFDVQDDISNQVTDALSVVLKLDKQSRLAETLTSNLEAYDLFLRGRHKISKRLGSNLPEGMALLRQSVELDPAFAEAWATLAEAEVVSPNYVETDPVAAEERAQQFARKAITLNTRLALPHAVIGLTKMDQGRFVEANEAFEEAHRLEPNNVLVLRWQGNLKQVLGYSKQALVLHQRALMLDPVSTVDAFNNMSVQLSLGNLDEAKRHRDQTIEFRNQGLPELAGDLEFLRGDPQAATAEFMRSFDDFVARRGADRFWSRSDAEVYARAVYGNSEEDREAIEALGEMFNRGADGLWAWQLYMHIKVGSMDRAFEILSEKSEIFTTFAADYMWLPMPGSVKFREDPRFPALLQRQGTVDAWLELGWPDRCEPMPGTDGSDGQFSCS